MKEKLKIPYPLIHPTPIVIIGTKEENRINFSTIGDVAVAGLHPALVMVSLHEHHLTTEIIKKTHQFSINIPTSSMMKYVDYCGVISGKDKDKSPLFKTELVDNIPILTDSPINLIVKVEHTHQIQQRVIMICSVMQTLVSKACKLNGQFDLSNIDALVYGLDNRYYRLTDAIGIGYAEYKKV